MFIRASESNECLTEWKLDSVAAISMMYVYFQQQTRTLTLNA